MKIFYDHLIFTSQKYGGISRYIINLIQHLTNLNNELDINVFLGLHINEWVSELPSEILKYNLKFPKIKYTFKLRKNINNLLFKYFLNCQQRGLIHFTYYNDLIKYIPSTYKKIITVHDMIHEEYPYFFKSKDNTSIFKKEICNCVDAIICISNYTKKKIIEFFEIDKVNIYVIHHGVKLLGKKIILNKIIKEPYILYVGSRHLYKNFNFLLRVFAYSKIINLNFKLVCFGGGKFNKKEKQLIERYKIANKIINIQGNDDILINLYKNATAFLFPSKVEGFGMPILEAMKFECPVFCSNIEVFKEIGGSAIIPFDPESEESLKYVLENKLFDIQFLNEKVKAGKKNVEKYSWSACALKTLDVYKRVYYENLY